ncbi:segregation/condensation protein A, partial [Pseudomonas syringae]
LKSRLLLPKPKTLSIEKDPKQQLIQKLETYLRIKNSAEQLNQLNILDRDTFSTYVSVQRSEHTYEGYEAESLKHALMCIFNRPE